MISDSKLAESFRDLEGDLRHVRRLAGLAPKLFLELPPSPEPEDGEEVAALIIALEAKAREFEALWETEWEAAGGRP